MDVLIASDLEQMVKPHKSLALVEEFQTWKEIFILLTMKLPRNGELPMFIILSKDIVDIEYKLIIIFSNMARLFIRDASPWFM